jgi:hypothetical protein
MWWLMWRMALLCLRRILPFDLEVNFLYAPMSCSVYQDFGMEC